MKLKFLLILPLLIAALSCTKDEPTLPPDWDTDDALDSNIRADNPKGETTTAKGWVEFKLIKKSELPAWLVDMTESITKGYIMKAGSGNDLLYFVYDTEKEFGQHYDAQGHLTPDKHKLKDWAIIYKWDPSRGMSTPLGWVGYSIRKKEELPEWLQSKTDGISKGYIMMGGYIATRKYFVYDEDKEHGQFYDDQGNTEDNTKYKNWVIIHKWSPED